MRMSFDIKVQMFCYSSIVLLLMYAYFKSNMLVNMIPIMFSDPINRFKLY